jgi:hypothetical protein
MCIAMCNVHLSSNQAQSMLQRTGLWVEGAVNHCTYSDGLRLRELRNASSTIIFWRLAVPRDACMKFWLF